MGFLGYLFVRSLAGRRSSNYLEGDQINTFTDKHAIFVGWVGYFDVRMDPDSVTPTHQR